MDTNQDFGSLLNNFSGSTKPPTGQDDTGLGSLLNSYTSPRPQQATRQVTDTPVGGGNVDEFVKSVTPAARRVAQRLNVPVEAVIGQWGLETGWGKSVIPGTNNLGNIKGRGVAATDNMTGSRDEYRQYGSVDEFADDFTKLVGNGRYKAVPGSRDAQGYFQNLKAAGYAEDPDYVAKGGKAAAMAAEALKRVGVEAPAKGAQLPDLATTPKWSQIASGAKFKALSSEEQQSLKAKYFDEVIAPHAQAAGADVASERTKFLATKPGLLDQAWDAAKGMFDGKESVLEGAPPAPELPTTSKVPVRKEVRAAFNAAWDSATPEQRAQMQAQEGWTGMLARERAGVFERQDTVATPTTQKFDPRVEARRARMVGAGEDPAFAERAALEGASRGVVPGRELEALGGMVQKSEFDFDTKAMFDTQGDRNGLNNPLGRGVAKAVLGTGKAAAGYMEFLGDLTGMKDGADGMRQWGKSIRGQEEAMGQSGSFLERNLEGAISSIGQQLPLMIAGVGVGSQVLPLAGMALQSFGQEYSDGKAAGQSLEQAAARAGLFAAFEVIGEKFGLGEQMAALKGAAKGMPSDQIINLLWSALKKEVPGEVLTTTGQFSVDKFAPGGIGLNPNATFADYVKQVGDTITQTIMQSMLMGAGTTGVSTAVRYMKNRGPLEGVANADAELARQQALNKWNTLRVEPTMDGAPVAPAVTPNGRIEPTGTPEAQSADAIVAELAQQAGVPVETVLPTPTPPVNTLGDQPADVPLTDEGDITDQDVIDMAAARYQQLRQKRDGAIQTTVGETGMVDQDMPGVGLSPAEAQELAGLERANQDPAALRAMYGLVANEGTTEPLTATPDTGNDPLRLTPEEMAEPVAGAPVADDTDFSGSTDEELARYAAAGNKYAAAEIEVRNAPAQPVGTTGEGAGVFQPTQEQPIAEEPEQEVAPAPAEPVAEQPATPPKPRTEREAKQQKALDRIARGSAYFAKEGKAREWVVANGLTDTHTVERDSSGANKWNIVAKKEATSAQATETKQAETQRPTQEPAGAAVTPPVEPPAKPKTEKEAKAKREQADAPGTRVNGDVERKAADRLEQLHAQMVNITNRNSLEGNAKAAVRNVIEELRKAKTVVSVEAVLNVSADALDRNYSAFADVIREVSDSLGGDLSKKPAETNTSAEPVQETDLNAMFDDVLAEEVAKDEAKAAKPRAEKEAKAAKAAPTEDDLYSARAELKNPTTLDEFIGAVDAGYRAHFDYAGTAGRTIWIEKVGGRGWVMKSVDDDNKGVTSTKGGAGLNSWDKLAAMQAAERDAEYRFTEWKPTAELSPLLKARNDLMDLRTQAEAQGMVADDRLLERVRRQEKLVKELEAEQKPKTEREAKAQRSNNGPHYAAGMSAFAEGKPRVLPSYFTKPGDKNSKDWYRGWDAANAAAPTTEREAKANRTATQAAASAATNTAQALNNAIDGLGALFGGNGKLGSGLSFDEQTYAKAKPLFQAAVANLGEAGKDIKEAMRAVVRMVMDKFGAQAAQNMKPYVVRYVEEISQKSQESSDGIEIYPGKGTLGSGKFGATLDGESVPGGLFATEQEARAAAEAYRKTKAQNADRAAQDQRQRDYVAGLFRGGKEVSNAQLEGIGFDPYTTDMRDFMGQAARLFGLNSRQIRPIVQPLIKNRTSDMGVKTEYVNTRKALQAIAESTIKEQNDSNDTTANQGQGTSDQGPRGNDQPGSGQADQKGVENSAPADVAAPARAGRGKRSGTGAASGDVGGDGQLPEGGNATNGRSGTGRTGVAADGAGKGRGNYHIADPEQLIGGTPKVRFQRNKKAIEAYQSITSEGREPTKDDLDAMAGYIGWGSFGQELFKGTYDRPQQKDGWQKESDWLREHLGEADWKSAQASIINAHYTDPITVATMWDMVRKLGFTGGRVLEPSMGVGNFYGLMPLDLMAQSKLAGIEMDPTTGGMAKLLYPDANIQIKPYQDSKTADGFYDLVIGNWPFAKDGPADRRYLKLSPSLHDYFFLKALDQTRPGGLVVGITSAGTMDKQGTLTRAALAEKADLVASFRLPSGAFEKYAGTSVVTDIIILKKRETPNADVRNSGWLQTVEVNTPSGQKIKVNEYYAKNPGNVLGTLNFGSGSTYGRPSMIVDRPADLEQRMAKLADMLPAGVFLPYTTKGKTFQYVTNNTKDREQSITEKDGALFQVHGEYLAPLHEVVNYKVKDPKKTAAREDQIRKLVSLRRLYGDLIDAERDGADDVEAKRKALSGAYTGFVSEHGLLNDSDGLAILKKVGDPFYPSLASLETASGQPASIMSKATMRAKKKLDKPSVRDALIMARNESVFVNMANVAQLAGVAEEAAAKELMDAGAVFQTPDGTYEVSDVYLSGNVRRKLREAEAAAEDGMNMARNIEALKKVLPADVPYFNIEAKMGATWIRPDQYKQFIEHLLGKQSEGIEVRFMVNRWKVKFHDDQLNLRPEATTTWGAPGINFDRLLSHAIGNVAVKIWARDSDGNKFVNEEASAEANEKANKIREEFSNWLWADPVRKIEMEKTYNEIMNAIAEATFDGSFMTFEGMALQRGDSPFDMRSHQGNAVYRGLVNRRGIYAHEVGTGKTYTMGALAVESRRYGIAKKPLILAHNANSASVAREIGEQYPGAKLLYIDNLNPEKISVTMRQIANDDWDAVVVPHSLMDRFTLKEETLMEISRGQIEALEQEAIEAAQEDGAGLSVKMMDDEDAMKKVRSVTAKQLVHSRNQIIKKIKEMALKSSKEGAISFEDMGIDMIIVDEAHEFKKPPLATRMSMKGLNKTSSNQSISLMFLTDYVKKLNGGTGVHLFTGTPITNTVNEIYNMMRFVMDDQMARDGVREWDAWFNTFADSTNDVELTAAGEYEPITRLASFVNVPELRRMVGQYMDIVFADDMPEFKPRSTKTGKTLTSDNLTEYERNELLNGRTENPIGRPYKKIVNDVAEMSPEQMEVFDELKRRAASFKSSSKKERKEIMMSGDKRNPVLVETAAANAGLDPRLYDMSLKDSPTNKVNRVVRNVMHHYNEHDLATQVIFVDKGYTDQAVSRKKDKATGQVTVEKKPRFNLVKDIVAKLVAQGIPESQIAVVDGSVNKEKRKAIADAMNRAEIRVVIGQTDTLGVGVNMQANLRAMHHMDAPWMPGELEQRNGRGHRQGNKWNTVFEHRYITERIDGRRWQVLSIKDRFIKSFMKADDSIRVIEGDAVNMDEDGDLGATLSDAAGDPRLLMMNKLRADVLKLENKERMHAQGIVDAIDKIKTLNQKIKDYGTWIERYRKDLDKFLAVAKNDLVVEVGGRTFTDAEKANDAMTMAATKVRVGDDPVPIAKVWGFTISAYQRSSWIGIEFKVEGEVDHSMGKGTIESARATMYGIAKRIEKMETEVAEAKESIPRMQEASKAPFARAADLEKKRKLLADLEFDIQKSPVPAPAWLRNGAPINTAAFVDGKPFVVEGHRYTDEGYFVTVSEGDATRDVPYMEVTDENGLPKYEEHEFEPPKIIEGEKGAVKKVGANTTDVKFQAKENTASPKAKPTESDLKNVRTLNSGVVRYLQNHGQTVDDGVLGYVAAEVPGDAGIRGIAKAWGQRLQWFMLADGLTDSQRQQFGFFNGANIGGTTYLNAATDRPHLAVLGHEVVHQLRRDNPDLYEEFADLVRPYIKPKAYALWRDTSKVAKTAETMDKKHEEFMAEIGSDAFMDAGFWERIGQNNPALLGKIVAIARQLIAMAKSALGYSPKTQDIVTDYDAVMQIASDVLARYMGSKVGGGVGEINFNAKDSISNVTRRIQNNAIQFFGNRDKTPSLKTFGAFDKTLATQFHKALKDKHYGKVFAYVNAMQNEVSLTSIRPAELAPGVLPRVDDVKSAAIQLVKGKKADKNLEVAATAIFAGTLYGDNVLGGKVFTEAEFMAMHGATETAYALYRQSRDAIDASLDEVAAAEAYAMAQGFVPKAMRRAIIDNPQQAESMVVGEIDRQIKTLAKAIKAAERMGAEQQAAELKAARDGYLTTRRNIAKIFTTSKNLKAAGYAPLMRFGKYTVTVQAIDPDTGNILRNEDGESITEFYGQYETEGEAKSVRMMMEQRYGNDPGYRVTAGTKSQTSHELYAGISPETLALFAEAVGADQSMRKYIELAMSERSALKRRLERKGTAGYSMDMPRVLSNFITSNGRHAAQRYYLRDLNNAIKYIPKEKGDVLDEAMRLKKFVMNPSDPAAPVSSIMFAWFLGGSVASALVNLSQPVMMTGPYLSQFGVKTATKSLAEALPYALGKKEITDAGMRDALKRASQEGIVDAQEIFHLYSVGAQGVASGLVNTLARLPGVGNKIKAGSEDARARINAFLTLWGSMFSLAESFNRKLTFIAAYKVAQANGEKSPYQFAVRAVNETQGIYNKVNRPNWAQGPVGRTILTFKQFSIMYVELLSRMVKKGGPEGKRAALIMLAVLMLAAGEEGLPFAQDLDDLIDTLGQLMGYDTNMKRWKRRHAHEIMGKELGDLFLYGVSSQLPLDFAGRLGMGNLIPGTGLLKPSTSENQARDVAEVFGPAAGLISQVADAYGAAVEGNMGKAAQNLAPTAVKNALAGAEMAVKGYATDTKGRKVVEVDGVDAAFKFIGFQPTQVARETRKTMPVYQDLALQKRMESSIVAQWAQAVADGDNKAAEKQQKRLTDWNNDNPDTPIRITPDQIRNKARQLATERDARLLKQAPREMRGRVGLDLAD